MISYSINVFLQQTCDFWHAIEAVDLDYTIICPRNDYDAVRCAVGLRYGTVRLYVVAREPMQYRCVIEGYPLARSSLLTCHHRHRSHRDFWSLWRLRSSHFLKWFGCTSSLLLLLLSKFILYLGTAIIVYQQSAPLDLTGCGEERSIPLPVDQSRGTVAVSPLETP